MLFSMVIFVSCENDMKDIDRLANIKDELLVNISKDVTVTYSDSAKVKAVMTSPQMVEYTDTIRLGDIEFPKGVLIVFYGLDKKETQRIKSDYGLQRAKDGIVEFRRNVVITRIDGSVAKTEELFYDEKNARFYNTVPIVFDFKDNTGSTQASSFESNSDFTDIKLQNHTGYRISTGSTPFPSFGN